MSKNYDKIFLYNKKLFTMGEELRELERKIDTNKKLFKAQLPDYLLKIKHDIKNLEEEKRERVKDIKKLMKLEELEKLDDDIDF